MNDNTTASAPIAEIVETVAAEMTHGDAWITNRAAVLGILLVILAVIFRTSSSDSPRWKKFYGIVPSILLCYFIPGVLGTFGIIGDPGGDLYYVASRFLLPTCLVLLCLAIDLPGIFRLGPKLLIIFFTATAGIILGGPFAIWVVSPLGARGGRREQRRIRAGRGGGVVARRAAQPGIRPVDLAERARGGRLLLLLQRLAVRGGRQRDRALDQLVHSQAEAVHEVVEALALRLWRRPQLLLQARQPRVDALRGGVAQL